MDKKHIVSFISVGTVVLMLSGCASWQTSTKTVDVNQGNSISIDAKQRIIYSNAKSREYDVTDPSTGVTRKERKEFSVICAEPSPDALSVLGASGALSVVNPTGVEGSAAAALAESAASIGLRTQSIQLLRDLNYRICEAYSNGAIGEAESAALLRRGQSTMMGLIAIEQLTGPVVASQFALSTAVAAGKGTSSASDLTAAQGVVEDRKSKLLTAQSELDKSKAAYDEAAAKHNELLERRSSLPSPGDDSTSEQKALKEQIKLAESDRQTTKLEFDDKARRVKVADQNRLDAERELNRLRDGTLNTSAATQVAPSEAGQRTATAARVTEHLVNGVANIVEQINNSYILDSCFSLVSDTVRTGGTDSVDRAMKACTFFIDKQTILLKESPNRQQSK